MGNQLVFLYVTRMLVTPALHVGIFIYFQARERITLLNYKELNNDPFLSVVACMYVMKMTSASFS